MSHRKRLLCLIGLFLVLLIGCDDFNFYDILKGGDIEPLEINPSEVFLPTDEQWTFSAIGGIPQYTYSILFGLGDIDETTGVYTAPSSTDDVVVRVTDSVDITSDAVVMIFVAGSFTVVPASITITKGDSVIFTAIGGTPPYTYSIVSGDGSIDANTGFYTAPDEKGITVVRVTDFLYSMSDATVKVLK